MIFAIVSVILNAAAQVSLKKATMVNSGLISPMLRNPFLYFTAVLYMTSIITWFLALSRIQLSLAYPLQAIGYLIVTIAAIEIFKERVSVLNWLGLVLILAGVVLTQSGKQ